MSANFHPLVYIIDYILGIVMWTLVGRVASFFGDELVVGSFVYGFSLFFISFLIMQNTNNYVIAISILSIIIVSFLIIRFSKIKITC